MERLIETIGCEVCGKNVLYGCDGHLFCSEKCIIIYFQTTPDTTDTDIGY